MAIVSWLDKHFAFFLTNPVYLVVKNTIKQSTSVIFAAVNYMLNAPAHCFVFHLNLFTGMFDGTLHNF